MEFYCEIKKVNKILSNELPVCKYTDVSSQVNMCSLVFK